MLRPRPALFSALLLLLVLAPVARAAEAPAAKKAFGVDDLWAVQRVGTPVLSSDGSRAACAVTAYEGDEMKANADLFLVDVASGASRRLTTNKASDTSPAWSPDGKRLAFVSKRDGDKAARICTSCPLDGGEPERLTDMPLSVSNPKWFPDGTRIAFVSRRHRRGRDARGDEEGGRDAGEEQGQGARRPRTGSTASGTTG